MFEIYDRIINKYLVQIQKRLLIEKMFNDLYKIENYETNNHYIEYAKQYINIYDHDYDKILKDYRDKIYKFINQKNIILFFKELLNYQQYFSKKYGCCNFYIINENSYETLSDEEWCLSLKDYKFIYINKNDFLHFFNFYPYKLDLYELFYAGDKYYYHHISNEFDKHMFIYPNNKLYIIIESFMTNYIEKFGK